MPDVEISQFQRIVVDKDKSDPNFSQVARLTITRAKADLEVSQFVRVAILRNFNQPIQEGTNVFAAS